MSTESLAKAFDTTREILAKVSPDQLDEPTPCRSWNVRELINHFIAAPEFATTFLTTGEATRGGEHDFTAGDYLAAYDETAREAVAAFGAPGALDKVIPLPFAEVPGSFLMMMITTDQFAHGWDLARATGQSTDLDPALATSLLSQTQASLSDEFRGEDGVAPFGPAQVAPESACAADQLAAFLGRSV
jgi:uncharacterized protein (TIGR03086 family)